MALSKEMHESERGLFTFHGLTGYFIAVALLLSILGGLTYLGIVSQQANAEKYYTVNQDLNGLKMNSPENHTMWQDK